MGEHLKSKLEDMIRQRFEAYLRIAQTLQNDIGKLAALECELRIPRCEPDFQARTSISCNEDGTFFVYTVPDFRKVAGPAEPASHSDTGPEVPTGQTSPDDGSELLRLWVKQVCEFGMSGRCHSLTALFAFGYTAWKQLLMDRQADGPWAVRQGNQDFSRSHIVEEEERPARDTAEWVCMSRLRRDHQGNDSNVQLPLQPAVEEAAHEDARTEEPSSAAAGARELTELAQNAKLAVDCERYQQALELCTEGISKAKALRSHSEEESALPAGSSSSSTSWVRASASNSGPQPSLGGLEKGSAAAVLWEMLSLRASLQAQLQSYDSALRDAEELIALQPTCAEGYYWQSTALWGMGRSQEALESLMSALEYEPQNPLFQQAFTSLFEEISAASAPIAQGISPRSGSDSTAAAAAGASTAATAAAPPAVAVLHGRRPRGRPAGDALSTTTQATRLSSRSTTPTEVSAPLSHSTSNDSLSVAGPAFDEQA